MIINYRRRWPKIGYKWRISRFWSMIILGSLNNGGGVDNRPGFFWSRLALISRIGKRDRSSTSHSRNHAGCPDWIREYKYQNTKLHRHGCFPAFQSVIVVRLSETVIDDRDPIWQKSCTNTNFDPTEVSGDLIKWFNSWVSRKIVITINIWYTRLNTFSVYSKICTNKYDLTLCERMRFIL